MPEAPDELTGELAAVGRVGEHVGDDAADDEALRWVAQRVDQPVVPGAAALEAADGGEPARILTVAIAKGRDYEWSGAVDGLRINSTVFDFEETGVFARDAE